MPVTEAMIAERRAAMGTIPGILEILRRKEPDILGVQRELFEDLLVFLIESGKPLEEHGTSVEELRVLRQSTHTCQAVAVLEHLRYDASDPGVDIGYAANGQGTIEMIKTHLDSAGLTYADIGTSEEELNRLIASPEPQPD